MSRTIYLPVDASPDRGSGIDVTYYPSLGEIAVSGWYDSFVGIQGERMPLGTFLRRLGITLRACERALAGAGDGS